MCTKYGNLKEMKRVYDIEPKPTIYRGINYRSRLEARWAVFFDALRINYEYEKQSFLIDKSVYYLPDFWLKNWIVEVKPNQPTSDEYYKARMVSYHNQIAIVSGNPNPDSIIYLFIDGKQEFVYPTRFEQVYCFTRGLSVQKWVTLKMLNLITNKKNFEKAFVRAERYQF